MKSGLEDRNNRVMRPCPCRRHVFVSMKSGLEDRNNMVAHYDARRCLVGLNEVRPGRPEQWLASEGRLD